MPDRWRSFCRRLVPDALRATAFDPAVEDLALRFAPRAGAARRWPARLVLAGRWQAAILAAALECRRLHGFSSSRRIDELQPHGDPMLMTWLQEARRAARRFAREPLFACVAVATLALGIGANVALFSFVNALLIVPLPVPAPHELLRVAGRTATSQFDIMSYPNYVDARDSAIGLDLAAHVITRAFVGAEDSNEARSVELVSGNYFQVLRLTAVAGRLLGPQDNVTEGAHPVVVIGEALWRARYGASPGATGQSIRLNGAPYEIVGVAPAAFRGTQSPYGADLWAPIMMQQQLRPRGLSLWKRDWGWLQMIGRIAPGATASGAQASLDRVAADINRRFPSKDAFTFVATPALTLPDPERRVLAPYLMMTFAFTVLLLIVTCANLAGVMQARVLARQRELAIRQSLGAGRGRLVSEWFTECVLLAVAGGTAGMLVASLATLAVVRFKPPVQLIGNLTLDAPFDWRVFGFAAAVSLGAACLFGLLPALRAAAQQPVSLLKEEAATSTGGRRGARLRRAAVCVQIATSAVLLLVSGLLAVSLHNLRRFNPGFRTDQLALVSLDLRRSIPANQAHAVTAGVLERVRALPGASAVDITTNVPLGTGRDTYGFRIPGYTPPDGAPQMSIDGAFVGAKYFKALGLAFVRGGTWDGAAIGTSPSVVINETMAKRFWPGRDPVGQTIEEPRGDGTLLRSLAVTGVVRDSAYYDVGEPPMPYVYLPAEARDPMVFAVVARTDRSPSEIARAIGSADPRLIPYDAMTFEDARQVPLYPQRMLASTASVFGAVALLLTGIGLYGVVSTSAGRRTREFGVRVALGAPTSEIQLAVLRESLTLVAIGALAGLGGGYVLAASLSQWLFGIAPFDVALYTAVALALGGVALLAAWVPARRASRVDPVVALRT